MLSQVNSLSPQSYSNFISSGAGGKIYVPVKPSQVIFSQFDHVSGVASQKGSDSGVSVSKIQILNTLIDQLIKIKTDVKKTELPADLTNNQLDALIKDYQNQVSTAIKAANITPFGLAGIAPEAGMVLDTFA